MQERIERLVFHHSAAWEIGGEVQLPTVEQLIELHIGKGWSGVGYHWIVDRAGVIHYGRALSSQPAAHKPHNGNSWAVCAIGWNGPSQPDPTWGWTGSQIGALQSILEACRVVCGGALPWFGHRDLERTSTECPGLFIEEVLR